MLEKYLLSPGTASVWELRRLYIRVKNYVCSSVLPFIWFGEVHTLATPAKFALDSIMFGKLIGYSSSSKGFFS